MENETHDSPGEGQEPTQTEGQTPSVEQADAAPDWSALSEEFGLSFEETKERLAKVRDIEVDATRKWQEASDMREQSQAVLTKAQMYDQIETQLFESPETFRRVIEQLQKTGEEHFGMQASHSAVDFGIPDEDMSEEGKAARKVLSAMQARINAQDRTIQGLLEAQKELKPIYEGLVTDRKTQADIAAVKTYLGETVTAEVLAAAKKATGLSDPIAAISVYSRRAGAAKAPAPPKTPSSDAKIADVTQSTKASEILAAKIANAQQK